MYYGKGGSNDCQVDKDCFKYGLKHTKPKKILLECGEGTGSRTFTTVSDAPFQLAYVTIDTTCLNRPKVLIKFSSSIRMTNLATNIQGGIVKLKYELFKSCNNENPISLGTWIYEQGVVALGAFDSLEETFSFNFCECTNSYGCCQYFVVVTVMEITNATAMVSNGNMAAFAQSLVHDLKVNDREEKHPKPRDILAVCGNGNGSVSYRIGEALPPPPGIAHVTVDTTCLKNPQVLIEFACNISLISIQNVELEFELLRVCNDGEPLSRGIWRFERIGSQASELTEDIFNFTFCECKAPSSCCEYFVILTVKQLTADFANLDVTVDNARMNAFAQGDSDFTNNHDYKGSKQWGTINSITKHPRPKEIILECGNGVGERRFTEASTDRFQVGQVTIDTAGLCKPLVNIEFSAAIGFELQIFDVVDLSLQLQIELFRACDNKKPVPIGLWVLENFDAIERSTKAFNFIACDCATCPGCCDYFVTVSPFGSTGDVSAVSIRDVRISALAWEA